MKSTTTRITDGPLTSVDLVALGARTGQLWRGETLAFAGVGRVAELSVRRPSDDGAVAAALAALTGDNELPERPGTGPLALGAFPFDRTATGSLQVPELALVDDGSDRWLTRFGGSEAEAVDRILDALDTPEAEPTELVLEPARTASAWRDEVVAVAPSVGHRSTD